MRSFRSLAHIGFAVAVGLAATPAFASPVDYDDVVFGAELLQFEGGVWSGLLDLDGRWNDLIPDVSRAFQPDGLRFGPPGEFQTRLGYALAGTVILAADSPFDTDEHWAVGQVSPQTQSPRRLLPEGERPATRGRAVWQVFASSNIELLGFEYDGINHWRLMPEVIEAATGRVERPGQLILTWENVPAFDQRGMDARRNSSQMILTHVGDGDADVELRFARCDWHADVAGTTFVVSGFHTGVMRWFGVDRDEVYYPGQTVYDPDSFTRFIKRKCAYSNIGETGVWHYQMRDGFISGCGIADAPYVRSPADQPGDLCSDNNNLPGDGCSPGCWVEGDLDDDGIPDAPPGEPRTADGVVVNPDGVYDTCISVNPERDCGDLDSDADGVLDRHDNCERVFNPEQADIDDDGIGDACDDGDGDGVPDAEDNCPLSNNADQADADDDGIGDACDLDNDADGVPDDADNCARLSNPAQLDADNDGIGDACDSDADGDDILDTEDNCVGLANPTQVDTDNDGIGDACDDDNDNDGHADRDDNCRLLANADQVNTDGDDLGDACDDDDDGDGVLDDADACPLDPSAFVDTDMDGFGDACGDADDDGDGTDDATDNCPLIANPEQTDLDGDAMGDACDDDRDGDAIDNEDDNCGDVANPDQLDVDGDGRGDACSDSDGDGVADALDNCPTEPNREQNDSDGNGIGDACDIPDDCDQLDGPSGACDTPDGMDEPDLDECRARTAPEFWAERCAKPTETGCIALPGRPGGLDGWAFLALLVLRRLRSAKVTGS